MRLSNTLGNLSHNPCTSAILMKRQWFCNHGFVCALKYQYFGNFSFWYWLQYCETIWPSITYTKEQVVNLQHIRNFWLHASTCNTLHWKFTDSGQNLFSYISFKNQSYVLQGSIFIVWLWYSSFNSVWGRSSAASVLI